MLATTDLIANKNQVQLATAELRITRIRTAYGEQMRLPADEELTELRVRPPCVEAHGAAWVEATPWWRNRFP